MVDSIPRMFGNITQQRDEIEFNRRIERAIANDTALLRISLLAQSQYPNHYVISDIFLRSMI